MLSLYETITRKRLEARLSAARQRSAQVLSRLSSKGVRVRIVGSLETGRFGLHSDVDFLVESLPDENLRYRLEGDVEDIMGDIPFDVLYLDEMS